MCCTSSRSSLTSWVRKLIRDVPGRWQDWDKRGRCKTFPNIAPAADGPQPAEPSSASSPAVCLHLPLGPRGKQQSSTSLRVETRTEGYKILAFVGWRPSPPALAPHRIQILRLNLRNRKDRSLSFIFNSFMWLLIANLMPPTKMISNYRKIIWNLFKWHSERHILQLLAIEGGRGEICFCLQF